MIESGLSIDQVKRLQEKYGENILPEKAQQGNFSLLIQQLKSPLIYVLLIAAVVTLGIGHYPDAAIIFLAVGINTTLGFVQERKASHALQALKHFLTSSVVVVRNGERQTVSTTELVPGDVVQLDQGVKVPADGILLSANRLYIDEAILTGESIPVKKIQADQTFMGTTISAGQAVLRVETIGSQTKMGAIALQIQEIEEDTPLQKQLKFFSQQLLAVVVILIGLVFLIGIVHQYSLAEVFTTSVALAVSSIPEGLIVSLTVVLAIGMQKILKRKGLVRKLSAAETLGGVTVICVDKTGTLTEGKLEVVDYVGNEADIAHQFVVANDLDDPLVIAAYEWAKKVLKNQLPTKNARIDSIPFSSKERFFISLHHHSDEKNLVFVNGAPDLLLQWTTLSDGEKQKVMAGIDRLTKQGKRLIGLARKDVPLNKKEVSSADAKIGLKWVGLVAFSDPVRAGVKNALQKAGSAGIRTIVITGDYAQTAVYVLSELGIEVNDSEVITGEELGKLSVLQLAQRLKTTKLFARTTPDQKLQIVDALKENGEVVAMMGDGVNDAPALHKADIGIAVGEASDVAKESAELILLDSNFATIIGAVEEGRAMFENIRKIILYLMSDAFAEIIVVLGSMLLGLPLPITAVQILWINLISDGFPDLTLAIDPQRAHLMTEKPRSPTEPLVNHWMITLISSVSLIAGLAALLSFVVVLHFTGDIVMARSMAFITLGLNSLSYVFSIKSLLTPFWENTFLNNKWLIVAVCAGFVLQIIPFSTPSLRRFFGIAKLDLSYWVVAIALSISIFFAVELFKFLYLRLQKSRH